MFYLSRNDKQADVKGVASVMSRLLIPGRRVTTSVLATNTWSSEAQYFHTSCKEMSSGDLLAVRLKA